MQHTEEIIELREQARRDKNWKLADELRNILDSKLSFVFDTPDGWLVYHLNDNYFKNKPSHLTNRQFLELNLKKDKEDEKRFDAWLYSQLNAL